MLGQPGYDLIFNNCEHFATWCVTGEHCSAQVENAASSAGVASVGVIVPPIGRDIVVGVGEAAAMSGPNLMSGLARLGGSVVDGIALVGAASGLLAGGTMCLALRDKPISPTTSAELGESDATARSAEQGSVSEYPSTQCMPLAYPATAPPDSAPG